MKSKTYNAVVTKSYETLSKLFFPKNRERASFDRFLKDNRNNRDILAISPGGNSSFIEMDINFPTSTKSKYLSLKMVDTKFISDFFVVDRHPTDRKVLDLISRSELVSGNESNQSVAARAERFYFSYGVGDDIRTWSGPYTMTLSNAEIVVNSDGVKEITLLFTPSLESIRAYSNLLVEDSKYAQLESRFDSRTVKDNKLKTEASIIFPSAGPGKRTPKPGYIKEYTDSEGTLKEVAPKWNYWIRALITQYIGNIFPSIPIANILVLFSANLDKAQGLVNLEDYLDTGSMLDHSSKLKKLAISISPSNKNEPKLPVDDTKSTIVRNITGSESAVIDRGSRNTMDDLKLGPELVTNNELQDPLDLLEEDLLNSLVYSPEGIANNLTVGNVLYVNADKSKETDSDVAAEATEFKLTMSHDVEFKDKEEFKSILTPLEDFYRTLREDREKNIKFTFFEESDSKIIRMLSDRNIISDPQKSVIIFGESEIIQRLIYPKVPFKNNPLPQVGESGLGSALTYLGEKDFKNYSVDYYSEFYRLRNRTSSFGEKIDFGPFGKSLNNKFKNNDLVLMHNVKNSNVLEVSFNNSGYLATLLMLAGDSEVATQANHIIQGEALKDTRVTNLQIINHIRDKINSDYKEPVKNFTREKLIHMLKTDENLATLVWESKQTNRKLVPWLNVITFLVANDEFPRPGPRVISSNRAKSYSDMLEDLNKYTVTAKVKTLPFFNHPQLFERKCFLFGLQNNIIGSVLSGEKNYSIFTGRYKIVGVRHYLSNEDAFSEFKLTRDDLVTSESEIVDSLKMHTVGDILYEIADPELINQWAEAGQLRLEQDRRGYLNRNVGGRTLMDILVSPRGNDDNVIELPPLERR